MSIVKMRNQFSTLFKPILIFIAGTFVVGGVISGFGLVGSGGQNAGSRESKLIAKVNGDKIMRDEYEKLLEIRRNYYEQMNPNAGAMREMSLRGEVLAGLVENRLHVRAAEKEGIRVSRWDVSREIDKLVEQRVDALRKQVLGEGQIKSPGVDRLLDRRLRQMDTQDSLSRRTQMFRAQFPRNEIHDMLMSNKLETKIRDGIKLSDRDILDVFKEISARHILISARARPEEQAKRRAEEVLKKIRAGGDFTALAREFSEDPGTKENGGYLPSFHRGTMVPEFEKAVFALNPGQTSGLVKTQFGYHIIKLEKVNMNLPPDFEKNKNQYRDRILYQMREQATGQYFNRLRQQAKIVITDPMLKALIAWQQAGSLQRDPALYESKLNEVTSECTKALRKLTEESPEYWMVMVLLSQVYDAQGKKDKALETLRSVLEQNLTEGADLRIMLGQLYLETGDKKRALEDFLLAADIGYPDPPIHMQLQELFEKVGRPDLAKKEKVWIDDYKKQLSDMQKQGTIPRAPGPMPTPPPSPGG